MRRRRALLSASLALCQPAVQAVGYRLRWTVFGSDRYEPLLYLKDGQPAGQLADVLIGSERHSGDRFDLRLMTWQCALRMAEAGEGGLLGVSRTRERELWLDYSVPIHEDDLLLVVRKGQAFRFRRVDDLQGKVLGMARGTTGGEDFDRLEREGSLKVERDTSVDRRLQALLAGRLDVAVLGGSQSVLDPVLAQWPDPDAVRGQLEVLRTPLLHDRLHLAFPKSFNAGALLQRFNAAVAAMRAAK